MKCVKNSIWIVVLLAGLAGAQTFTDVTVAAQVQNSLFSTNLAWADYDSDGDFDLYVTNWATSLTLATNALFRNQDDGSFENATATAGLNIIRDGGNSTAAAWADYDNDGDPDLYLADILEQDYLFDNDGGSFTEIGRATRLNQLSEGAVRGVAWGDYNSDGYLDIYLAKSYHDNQLYHNNSGDGSFERVRDLLVLNDGRDASDANWVDYDNDGDMDLFVVNREQENALYRNDLDTAGTFVEVFGALGLANMEIGQKGAWADYDNDGDMDLYLANVGANALYRNEGADLFVDVAGKAGVRHTGQSWRTAAAAWADYDGDGDFDLYLASGRDDSFSGESQGQSDVLFENSGDGTFSDVTSTQIPRSNRFHMAAGWGDYNGDGAPDLYVVDGGNLIGESYMLGFNQLFENTTPSENFIRVRVRGRGGPGKTNQDGIGARVFLLDAAGDTLAYQQVLPGPSAPELTFGTPPLAGEGTYAVKVVFPNGILVEQPEVAGGGEPIEITEP